MAMGDVWIVERLVAPGIGVWGAADVEFMVGMDWDWGVLGCGCVG